MKITKNTKVSDAIKNSGKILMVFTKYNLDCPNCKGAGEDTIEKAAINNGIELNEFIKDLNSALQQ